MKQIYRIFISLLFTISSSCIIGWAQENQSYFLHTIEKGQSLYSISSMYNVTSADIIQLNPGCEEKIYAGQTLKIPKHQKGQIGETFHTIQAGETLYKLTTIYKISAKAICEANPGLSAENFRIGQVILIPLNEEKAVTPSQKESPEMMIQEAVKPKCKEIHKVKRKETIFSVSREYGISEQELIEANPELKEGMKKGQLLCIPYPKAMVNISKKEEENINPPSNKELFEENKETQKKISTVKVALILPFHEDKRMIEYYEGFLMAIDSLKRIGTSIDVYAYDSGKGASLNSILSKKELKEMDVIFGPMHQEHIKPLSEFAQKNNITNTIKNPKSIFTSLTYKYQLL